MPTRTVVVFALLALVACIPTSPPGRMVVHDETGAAFHLWGLWVDEIPDVTPPPLTCDDGSEGSYVGAFNPYFFISSACPGQQGYRPRTERCVACLTDTDCPESGDMFECHEGLCRHSREWNMDPSEYVCGNTTPREDGRQVLHASRNMSSRGD